MPPVVQNTRGIHEIGKDRVCKNQLSGRTDVPLHTYIHTEKFHTVVTKLRLATLAPIIISTKYLIRSKRQTSVCRCMQTWSSNIIYEKYMYEEVR